MRKYLQANLITIGVISVIRGFVLLNRFLFHHMNPFFHLSDTVLVVSHIAIYNVLLTAIYSKLGGFRSE